MALPLLLPQGCSPSLVEHSPQDLPRPSPCSSGAICFPVRAEAAEETETTPNHGVPEELSLLAPRGIRSRLLTATSRDLAREARTGRFCSDPFFRLDTFAIAIPPLRKRREDVLALARFFLDHVARRLSRPTPRFSVEAERALLDYDFPGNVRERLSVAGVACHSAQNATRDRERSPPEASVSRPPARGATPEA